MIREYKNKDADQITEIYYKASIIAHNFLPEKLIKNDIDMIKNELLPAGKTWVFTKNNTIKASISLFDKRIGGLFVLPSLQGCGIGTALINHVKNIYNELTLEVFKQNEKSISFYKKCGFKIIDENIDEHTGVLQFIMHWKKDN